MLLIGSQAAKIHNVVARNPRDYDVICSITEYEGFCKTFKNKITSTYPIKGDHMIAFMSDNSIFEFSIAWSNSSNEDILNQYLDANGVTLSDGLSVKVASLETLLLLKLSHRYLRNSPHFLKTMKDIYELRKYTNLSKNNLKLLKKREKETYNYSHPKLNQSKEQFFDASVKYTYNHDDIHLSVAHDNIPAYEYFKEDLAEVYCSKKKFFELSNQIQLNAILEECYVLAIERSLVPFPGKLTPKEAFLKALEKVCTSITSGWFREFSYNHYFQVIENYDDNYFKKFKEALINGRIRSFQK